MAQERRGTDRRELKESVGICASFRNFFARPMPHFPFSGFILLRQLHITGLWGSGKLPSRHLSLFCPIVLLITSVATSSLTHMRCASSQIG